MHPPLLLHITDAHLTGEGVELPRDDHKAAVPGIVQGTREEALSLLLSRLAERLTDEGRELDCVVFTGDAAQRGKLAGHYVLRDLIIEKLGSVGITPSKIVATPGNHDVPRDSFPGSVKRYEAFISCWRDAGCVTPWLDGVDDGTKLDGGKHRLVGAGNTWAVFPVNSANWSHATLTLDAPLKNIWRRIPGLVAGGDAEQEKTLTRQLEDLIHVDMARVSETQLEVLRRVVAEAPQPDSGRQIRIVAIHHHLRTPSLREEVKAFSDFTNLELLRMTLRERRIDVVLHGHKHQHAAHRDLIYDTQGRDPRRLLVISGATFDERNEADAVRVLQLAGLPWVPMAQLTRFSLLRPGTDLQSVDDEPIALWRQIEASEGSIVIQGDNLDTVYHRACEMAQGAASGTTLIVDLDLLVESRAGMPTGYPAPPLLDEAAKVRWFDELAGWWQARHSRLEQRVPYHHGTRLHSYGGVLDQIARVSKLLDRKASSRAIAVLVDPLRDFTPDAVDEENFPSFCLVQFRRRNLGKGRAVVDVVGYFRAQEFRRWWPINVSELRALQLAVCAGSRVSAGRITTVTAEARVIGRSPTEVSVPVVDRWLDQHPGRLFLLATSLAGDNSAGISRDEVIRDWFQSLADFEQATEDYTPDGVPLAIEGLETLACYLEALEPVGDLKAFLGSLKGLASSNRAYAATKQERADFQRWGARDHLGSLRSISMMLLRAPEGIAARGQGNQ